MEENEKKVLRVSDCHHSGYRTIDIKRKDGSYGRDQMHVCDFCSQECKIIDQPEKKGKKNVRKK